MELIGQARSVAERFDNEQREVEDLVRISRDDVDPQMLRARFHADRPDEWVRPMTALARFIDTRQALVTLLEQERAGLAQHERAIAAIERRHAGTPVGRPERDWLAAQAREAVAHGAQLRHNVLELERRLTGPPDPLVDEARVGLAIYLSAVLKAIAESIATPLERCARQAAAAAMDLVIAITDYEATVGRAEQAVGQPLRVPRPTYPERQALEAVGRARGIEWTTTTAQAAKGEAEVAR